MSNEHPVVSRENRQRLQSLRLLDDDFMRLVFDNNIEATELLLNVFFDRYDMKVLTVTSQREIKNPNGRSVRLDIYAVDSDGRHYDIEVQRQDTGAGERRARFNSSMLDSKLLQSGQNPDVLPDSYIIFITENDIRKQNRPIYRFDRCDTETGELFDDGSHIIYVNAAYKNDDSRIGQLMHDFRTTDAENMHNKVLADKVRYFKQSERGQGSMCRIVEEIANDIANDIAKDIAKDMAKDMANDIAKNMADEATKRKSIEITAELLKMGQLSFDVIAKTCGLSLQEVENIAKNLPA